MIVEYFTKFPYAVPIKSKQAQEITRHLWDYFCLFCHAKEILSNQGTEFVNETVDTMLKNLGSKYAVTSPSSRTNMVNVKDSIKKS